MKPLSYWSLLTLRYLKTHRTSMDGMRAFRQMVLYSLYYRGHIDYEKNHIVVTSEGSKALRLYGGIDVNIWRKEQKELSKRVRAILTGSASAKKKARAHHA